MKKHKPCFCDKCLYAHYNFPCKGCPEGHSSFWKSTIESPQWEAWSKHANKKMLYDIAECEELGIISPKHFQDFLRFVNKRKGK